MRLGIGEPEDPRAAVARPVGVADREPLHEHDLGAGAGQPPRRGRAHDPRADDGDVHVGHPRSLGMVGAMATATDPGALRANSPRACR